MAEPNDWGDAPKVNDWGDAPTARITVRPAPKLDPMQPLPKGPLPAEPAGPDLQQEIFNVFSKVNENAIADTVGAPVDLLNAGLGKVGAGSQAPFGGSESIKTLMRTLGASREGAKPETTAGKYGASVLGGATEATLTGGPLGKLLSAIGARFALPAVEKVGANLAKPAGNIAAGTAGGAGGEALGSQFEGTPAEGAARAVGTLAGGAFSAPLSAVWLRAPKNTPQAVLAAYERLGLAPSAAEAGVGGRTAQWLEGNILPQTLGGSGTMERFKQGRLNDLTSIKERIASQYGTPRQREEAGRTVTEAVMDDWNGARRAAGMVIDEIGTRYRTVPVYAQNLVNAASSPVGEATTSAVRKTVIDPEVLSAQKMIRETGGRLTVGDLRALATHLGYKLEPGFQKNVNDAQIAQLRQAVVDDVGEAIRPRSAADYTRLRAANADYKKAMDDFRTRFKQIIGKEDKPVAPERAYEIVVGAATERGRADLAEFREVWGAMNPRARGDLAATIVSRLGAADVAQPGNPETFSLGKFISGYRDLSGEAKDLLFRGTGNAQLGRDLDDLATVAGNLQNKVAKLVSSSRSGVGGVMWGQLASGFLDPMYALYSIGGANMAAKVLTNPTAVRGLAATLRGWEHAVDAMARTTIDLETLPKLKDKSLLEKRSELPPDVIEMFGARKASDGKYYLDDPGRPGKFMMLS